MLPHDADLQLESIRVKSNVLGCGFFSHVRPVQVAGGFVVLTLIFHIVVMHHALESGVLSHL